MEKKLLKSTFSDKVFLKNLFSLALPIAFQSLMLSLVGASDTIMLGSLDQNSMAAVSLATQLQFIQNLTISGIIAAFQRAFFVVVESAQLSQALRKHFLSPVGLARGGGQLIQLV